MVWRETLNEVTVGTQNKSPTCTYNTQIKMMQQKNDYKQKQLAG